MKREHTLLPLFVDRHTPKPAHDHGGTEVHYVQQPCLAFRMLGLLAWGTTEESKLHDLRIGQQSCFLAVTTDGVPLELFDVRKCRTDEPLTFERAAELAKSGKLATMLKPFQKMTGDSSHVGENILAQISGPCTQLVVFGLCGDELHGPPIVTITRTPGATSGQRETYTGMVTIERLEGVQEICRVTAPDSAACATVLAGALQGRRGYW